MALPFPEDLGPSFCSSSNGYNAVPCVMADNDVGPVTFISATFGTVTHRVQVPKYIGTGSLKMASGA